jgi:hypothetical protein
MSITTLEELQSRKEEIAIKCKAKAEEINAQTDYITDNLGKIAIKSLIGNRLKHGSEMKSDILKILVAEGIDTAASIHKDPHDIKDKLYEGLKKITSGVLNLLFK